MRQEEKKFNLQRLEGVERNNSPGLSWPSCSLFTSASLWLLEEGLHGERWHILQNHSTHFNFIHHIYCSRLIQDCKEDEFMFLINCSMKPSIVFPQVNQEIQRGKLFIGLCFSFLL